jgi:hypothetical protein
MCDTQPPLGLGRGAASTSLFLAALIYLKIRQIEGSNQSTSPDIKTASVCHISHLRANAHGLCFRKSFLRPTDFGLLITPNVLDGMAVTSARVLDHSLAI